MPKGTFTLTMLSLHTCCHCTRVVTGHSFLFCFSVSLFVCLFVRLVLQRLSRVELSSRPSILILHHMNGLFFCGLIVFAFDRRGNTTLHWAASLSKATTVEFLVSVCWFACLPVCVCVCVPSFLVCSDSCCFIPWSAAFPRCGCECDERRGRNSASRRRKAR